MTPLTLTLPYPPTVNHYWKVTRQGRVYRTKQGDLYREAVALIAQPAEPSQCISKPVRLWAQVWMPDNRRRDIDNLSKSLLDSLTFAGVWVDDCLVHDFRITRMGLDRDSGGRVEAHIAPAPLDLSALAGAGAWMTKEVHDDAAQSC